MTPPAANSTAVPPVLDGPFSASPASELTPLPATVALVRTQVHALLLSTPSYHALPEADREELSEKLVRISAYAAECVRDLCYQSKRLGQTPVIRRRESVGPAVVAQPFRAANGGAGNAGLAAAQASNFEPRAANQIARITRETLKAVAFPVFVADLIRGTFDAIVRTNDHQMQSFMELVRNVGKSVDEFMQDNISDSQAMDWLAQKYPDHIQIRSGKAVPRESDRDRAAPNFGELHLGGSVDVDESSIEETLVPAARRRLAETRLQMLSTMVLMGINRIVITGGKIRATMGFHIDTTDRAREEHATDFDFRFAAQGGVNFALWSASASTSIAYVSSSRMSSDSEINVDTDLTGEVELHFKSDYFPIQRFAGGGALDTIRNNTAVPAENAPVGADGNPLPAAGLASGGEVGAYKSPRSRRSAPKPSALPPLGQLPEKKMPVAPDPVQPRPGGGDSQSAAPGESAADGGHGAEGGAGGAASPEGEDTSAPPPSHDAAPETTPPAGDAKKKSSSTSGSKKAAPKKTAPPAGGAATHSAEILQWSP